MSLRRTLIAFLAVLVVAVGGAALWWKWAPLHKHDYVARDERLLATLPPLPGTRELGRSVESVDDGSCDRAILCMSPTRTVGYRLYVDYSLPRSVAVRDVVAWYRRHLDGWHETHNVPAPLYLYARGRDRVTVDAQQIPYSRRRVEITVDAKP